MPLPTRNPYGISLPLQRGDSGYFAQSYDIIEQTKFNLITLLKTKKGERRMNPAFGSDLYSVLFQFNDEDLQPVVTNIITRDVQRWMPFLNINDIKIEATNEDKDTYRVNVSVIFTIDTLGITQPQEVILSFNQ
jgi:phage baseplate assembly protein W